MSDRDLMHLASIVDRDVDDIADLFATWDAHGIVVDVVFPEPDPSDVGVATVRDCNGVEVFA